MSSGRDSDQLARLLADLPPMLSVEEVADFLGLTTQTVYTMIRERRLPAFKVAKLWRITRGDLEIFIRGSVTDESGDAV